MVFKPGLNICMNLKKKQGWTVGWTVGWTKPD